MKDMPQDELLSAYLDGELTAEEQARVERMLAAEPAVRQLLDELRSLSATLQDLPQQTLGEDLSDRVLQLAERRMLTESQLPAEPAQLVEPLRPATVATTVRATLRRFLNARSLAWSGVAVAVAVMLMLSDNAPRDRNEVRRVAMTPATSKLQDETPSMDAAPAFRAAGSAGEKASADGSTSIDMGTADKMSEAGVAGSGAAESSAAESGASDWAMHAAETPLPSDRPAAAPALSAKKDSAAGRDLARQEPLIAAPASGSEPASEQLGRDVDSVERRVASKPDGRSARGALATKAKGGAMIGKTTAGEEVELEIAERGGYAGKSHLAGGLATVDKLETTNDAAGGGVPAGGEDRSANAGRLPDQDSGEYAVVLCDVSPEVVHSQSFVRLLVSNGITMQAAESEPPADRKMGEPPTGEQEPRGSAETMTSNSKALAGTASTNRSNYTVQASPPQTLRNFSGVAAGDTSGLALQDEASQRAAMPTSTEGVALNMFYVEATPTQIEATLAGLAAQPNQFLAVSVAPAPGIETQTRWVQYGYDNYSNGQQQFFRQDLQSPQPQQVAGDQTDSPARFRKGAPADTGPQVPFDVARQQKTDDEGRASRMQTDQSRTDQAQVGQMPVAQAQPAPVQSKQGPAVAEGGAEVQSMARAGVAQQSRVTETQSNLRTKSGVQSSPTAPGQSLSAAGRPAVESAVPQTAPPASPAVQLAEKPAEKANELSQSQSGQSASAGNGRAPGAQASPQRIVADADGVVPPSEASPESQARPQAPVNGPSPRTAPPTPQQPSLETYRVLFVLRVVGSGAAANAAAATAMDAAVQSPSDAARSANPAAETSPVAPAAPAAAEPAAAQQ